MRPNAVVASNLTLIIYHLTLVYYLLSITVRSHKSFETDNCGNCSFAAYHRTPGHDKIIRHTVRLDSTGGTVPRPPHVPSVVAFAL